MARITPIEALGERLGELRRMDFVAEYERPLLAAGIAFEAARVQAAANPMNEYDQRALRDAEAANRAACLRMGLRVQRP